LTAHADVALYKAKARGRAQFAAFSQEDVIAWRERKLWKKMLPEAIAAGQLALRYAPLFDLKTGACELVAVSIHWETSSFTLSNGDIFAVATESVVQHSLCDWLIAESLAQLARWRAVQPALGLVLPVTTDQCQQRGLSLVLQEILTMPRVEAASIYVPLSDGSEGAFDSPWGVSALIHATQAVTQSRVRSGLTLLEQLSDKACRYCMVSSELLGRHLDKGPMAVLKALAALGEPLEVQMLSQCLPASLAQPETQHCLGWVNAQQAADCWEDFITQAIDLAVVVPPLPADLVGSIVTEAGGDKLLTSPAEDHGRASSA
jgi:hypothetical protein